MPTDAEGELLVLLLDASIFLTTSDTVIAQSAQPDTLLQQVLTFVKTQLLLNERNHLCVMAVQPKSTPILFNTEHGAELQALSAVILERMLLLGKQQCPSGEPAMSAALSRALCYINRFKPKGTARNYPKPRILCILGSADVSAQYIAVMNAIFSAQATGIVIDTVLMASEDSAFMQQAAHITGGMYIRPKQPSGLLEYLLGMFSADTNTRQMLNVYKPAGVDFRASCFCHKQTIDVGYVCSVCLSIFCTETAKKLHECPTCGTSFKPRGQPRAKS